MKTLQKKPKKRAIRPKAAARPVEEVPLWKAIVQIGEQIPPDERAKIPHDGAQNYRHYLYGHEKDNARQSSGAGRTCSFVARK